MCDPRRNDRLSKRGWGFLPLRAALRRKRRRNRSLARRGSLSILRTPDLPLPVPARNWLPSSRASTNASDYAMSRARAPRSPRMRQGDPPVRSSSAGGIAGFARFLLRDGRWQQAGVAAGSYGDVLPYGCAVGDGEVYQPPPRGAKAHRDVPPARPSLRGTGEHSLFVFGLVRAPPKRGRGGLLDRVLLPARSFVRLRLRPWKTPGKP